MLHALLFHCLLMLPGLDPPVLFEEPFDGRMRDGWQWVREAPQEWKIAEGKLVLRSQPGGVWGGNDAKNVLLWMQPGQSAMEARVEVSHQPKKKFEQAGLLWYVDDDNFVKLISEHIEGKMYAVLASEQQGRGRVFGKVEMPQANVQLRLAVEGKQVTGQWRVKKSDAWSDCGSCEFSASGTPHFGLFTQTGSEEQVRWVRFDSFAVLGDTPNAR